MDDDDWRNKEVYGRDDKSGRTWKMCPLSDYSFDRLNHDIVGVPMYFNQKKVWPKSSQGITILWDGLRGLPDVRMFSSEATREQ